MVIGNVVQECTHWAQTRVGNELGVYGQYLHVRMNGNELRVYAQHLRVRMNRNELRCKENNYIQVCTNGNELRVYSRPTTTIILSIQRTVQLICEVKYMQL